MNNLDDLTQIKTLDKKNALESIAQLPFQIKQAWQESTAIKFPSDYKNISNIVISGMGGSTYGARIVKSLYDGAKTTKIPVELANNYWLPGYINPNTLVVLSSYSGNTEETLSAAKQAKERGVKIIGITSGGALAEFLKTGGYPSYIFDPIHNPSGQPRIGVGYMVAGLLGILAGLGVIPVSGSEITKIISFLENETQSINETVPTDRNSLKLMSQRLAEKIPIITVSDFLEGAAYAVRNPFHETAKQFALHFAVPELNHHLLEGLSFPVSAKEMFYFIFFESDIYDPRNLKRMKLTADVVKRNQIPSENIVLRGDTALCQVFELLQWGAWVTFYLAVLHGIDPSEIPWVDYFKNELRKEK